MPGFDLMIALMKTLVSLTNVSAEYCRTFLTDSHGVMSTLLKIIQNVQAAEPQTYIEKQSHDRDRSSEDMMGLKSNAATFDVLCLTIGLLENLLENCPEHSEHMHDPGEWNRSCGTAGLLLLNYTHPDVGLCARQCVTSCEGSDRGTGVELLSRIYLRLHQANEVVRHHLYYPHIFDLKMMHSCG